MNIYLNLNYNDLTIIIVCFNILLLKLVYFFNPGVIFFLLLKFLNPINIMGSGILSMFQTVTLFPMMKFKILNLNYFYSIAIYIKILL